MKGDHLDTRIKRLPLSTQACSLGMAWSEQPLIGIIGCIGRRTTAKKRDSDEGSISTSVSATQPFKITLETGLAGLVPNESLTGHHTFRGYLPCKSKGVADLTMGGCCFYRAHSGWLLLLKIKNL